MKRYPEYKESGVDWIGEIPRHWRLSRIDSLFFRRREKNTNIISNNILSVLKDLGVIRYEDKGNIGNKVSDKIENYQLVYAGDIVVNNMNVTIGSVGRSDQFGALSGIYIVLAPKRDNVDMGYYEYVFKIRPFQKSLIQISSGLMEIREALNFIEFKVLKLPTPPIDEQHQIAAFLDRKTGQIDELIRIKEQRITLLQEQRTALINQATTKGLDPNVEMKPSGVEWIEEIPAHWEIKQLKHMARGGLTNGLFKKKDQFGSGVKLINVIDMYQDDFLVRFEELDRVEAEPHEVERYAVEPGDIFFVRSSLKLEGVAASSCIADVPESTVFECHLVRLQPCPRQVLSKYLINYLNSTETRQRLITLANTVTMTTISQPKLASIEIMLPPLSEQQTIVDYLDQRSREINNLIATEQRKIELLKEYRQSLISEAVTGKIDVRNEV